MSWLVTGGAGYIGAHTVRRLRANGHSVVVLDDLSSGQAERLPPGVPLVVAAMHDRAALARTMVGYGVHGVVHLAARKSAAESVYRPTYYHTQNVGGLVTLLAAMADAGVRRLLFSSSAAVYGIPPAKLVTEDCPTRPINPYGHTKLRGEQLIRAAARAGALNYVALRYFNVAGADDALLADHATTNLVPIALAAVASGVPCTVTGTDFATRDGTGVRDYVHVGDVADAHAAAVAHLLRCPSVGAVFNVGTGRGHSVLEVLDRVHEVTGVPVPHRLGARRPGDPAEVVGDPAQIGAVIGWRARYDLSAIVASAWQARTGRLRVPVA